MNRPNTDANATAVFLTLLLTHYQTKGTRNYFLIIRNVAGGWSDDHTKAVAGILVVVPFVLQSAATSLKNCGTVPARQPGASGSLIKALVLHSRLGLLDLDEAGVPS